MNITINTVDNIHEAAKQFVAQMGKDQIFAFYGKMGAGKTTFIKAICEEMGVTDVINSPTFAIVNEYVDANEQPIYHFDFYRIKKAEEILDIGFEDYINSNAVCFMEWPEMIEEYLPEETIRLSIQENEDGTRTISNKID